MAKRMKVPGALEAGGANTSYTDQAGAYLDYDGASYAQVGAKAGASGSLGLKLRTIAAGVVITAITIAASGVMTAAYGGIFQGQSGATGRSDAQIEVQNDTAGTYHALISIFNRTTPAVAGNAVQEGAISYQAYDSTGVVRQVASVSAIWSNSTTTATGYGVLRLNVDKVDSTSDIAQRIYATQGIVFYGPDDVTPAGGKWLKVYRTANRPSLVGNTDLVLDANWAGASDNVFLNAYNAGNVILALGGGRTLFGHSVTTNVAAGEICLANAKAIRGVNAAGTDTIPLFALNANGYLDIGGGYAGSAFPRIIGSAVGGLNAGGTNTNGVIAIDTTNNRFVFYSGGNRYYVTGTSF